jgi:type II secretory pathway component PulF
METLTAGELRQAVQTLGLLMRRRYPLRDALKAIGDERSPWVRVSEHVEAGDSVGTALRRYPHLFSPFFAGMVQGAENSQNGEAILGKLSQWLEVSDSVRLKVRDLLHYPALMMSFLLMEAGLMLGYGLPVLIFPLYYLNSRGGPPEWSAYLLNLASLLCFLLSGAALLSSWNVKWLLPLAGKLPAFRKVSLRADQALWARAVAAFLQAGTTLPEALAKCHDLVWNKDLAAELRLLEERLQRGDSFSQALSTTNIIDPGIRWAVTAGEAREDLSATLLYAAEGLEHGLQHQCQAFMTMLQPAAVVLIGLMTALLLAPFWWSFYHYSWNLGLSL